MNAKERFYSGMARETIGKITANKDNWTAFLTTMARNYDFTYPEQVMIYAQRPNATFCKPYEDWNDEKYRRYVKRGSTGIALFVTNRDKPYLRYVFDVADTGVRRSSPELKPWEVTADNRDYVMDAMERTFGVKADGLLEAQLEVIAQSLASEYSTAVLKATSMLSSSYSSRKLLATMSRNCFLLSAQYSEARDCAMSSSCASSRPSAFTPKVRSMASIT